MDFTKLTSCASLWVILILHCFITQVSATDYFFNGSGSYTSLSFWTPSYPGGIIDADDNVTIVAGSECLLPTGTLLLVYGNFTNNAELITENNFGAFDGGHIINNGYLLSRFSIDNLGSITNNGELYCEGSFSNQGSGDFVNGPNGTITIYSTFIASTINGGSYLFNGAMQGEGNLTVQDYTNFGTIAPGFSPGILTFNNNLVLDNTGNVNIEIAGNGGSGNPNGHDQIIVNKPGPDQGDVSLNGTLNVSLLNGFVPVIGDEYEIIVGNPSGTFSNLQLPAGVLWEVVNTGTSIILKVLDAVVPVTLLSFSGNYINGVNILNWETSMEINNLGWTVQRSADGKAWKELSFINGMSNSSKKQAYTFNDNYPENGANYYRIIQEDEDHNLTESKIININTESNLGIAVYPNPTSGKLFFSQEVELVSIYSLQMDTIKDPKLSNKRSIDLSSLPEGIYILALKHNNQINYEKIIKK